MVTEAEEIVKHKKFRLVLRRYLVDGEIEHLSIEQALIVCYPGRRYYESMDEADYFCLISEIMVLLGKEGSVDLDRSLG